MKHLREPALSALLLGLLALLLFGNCGGGVRGLLYSLTPTQRRQLYRTMQLEERARQPARQQHGAARRQAIGQLEGATQRRLDSLKLTDYQQRKVHHRWRRVSRQLPSLLRADSLRQRQARPPAR